MEETRQIVELELRLHEEGLLHGPDAIPARWLDKLELRDVIEQVARDIGEVPERYHGGGSDVERAIWARYPGW
ncbi:hypothetical protein D3C78_1625440 [compost metagenome]